MAARATREEWSKRVERWHESGLTAQEFAAELGVNPRTLTYWKWVLTKGPARDQATRSKTATAVPFVEVGQTPSRADVFELELSDGIVVRVPLDFDAAALRRLLEVVGRAS
jgi:hypothetical protein